MALLQNTVKDIPQLSIVDTLDNIPPQPFELGHDTPHRHILYDLLINPCVRYNATPSMRRNVHAVDGAHDHNGITDPPPRLPGYSSLQT